MIGIISKVTAKNRLKKVAIEKAGRAIGYHKAPVGMKVLNNVTSFVGPMALADACLLSSLNHTGNVAQNVFVGVLVASAGIFRHAALQVHKDAVKEAAKLGVELRGKSLSSAEKQIVIKDHLSQRGNLIFSKLFETIYPKRVQKLAEGIETKSGFIG